MPKKIDKLRANLDYELISAVTFLSGVLLLGAGAVIQFATAMGNIGEFSEYLRITGSSGMWILPFVVMSLFGVVSAGLIIWKRTQNIKHNISIASSAVLSLLMIIFGIVKECEPERCGIVLFCEHSVKGMLAIVICYIIATIAFIVSKITKNYRTA